MLTAYVATLVIGGAFVGLSLLAGDGDVDMDVDGDLDLDLDGDVDAGAAGPTLSDAAHGVDDRKRRRPFNPLFNFRFWTFGLAGFGLTGVLLTYLGLAVEPIIGAVSGGVGAVLGLTMAMVTRALAAPMRGDAISIDEYVGRTATLAHAVEPGGITRLRVRVRHRERDLLARTAEPLALPAGAQVVILNMDEEGRAIVAPETEIFGIEAPQVEEESA